MKAYMRSFYKWLKSWVNKAVLRKTPTYVRMDLEEWEHCLRTFDTRPLIPSPEAKDVEWVGDASSSFGVGVLVGRYLAYFKLEEEWQSLRLLEGRRSIAWGETVAIWLGLLVLNKIHQVKGQ